MNITQYEKYEPRINSEIVSLIVSTQKNEFYLSITLEDQPDLLDIQNYYEAFWVAISDEKVVGTIGLVFFGKNAAIRKMFVHKDWRGPEKAIAQNLLETLELYCKNNHIQTIYLDTVREFKAAIRFYERNGFGEILQSDLPHDYPLVAAHAKLDRQFFKKECAF